MLDAIWVRLVLDGPSCPQGCNGGWATRHGRRATFSGRVSLGRAQRRWGAALGWRRGAALGWRRGAGFRWRRGAGFGWRRGAAFRWRPGAQRRRGAALALIRVLSRRRLSLRCYGIGAVIAD